MSKTELYLSQLKIETDDDDDDDNNNNNNLYETFILKHRKREITVLCVVTPIFRHIMPFSTIR
jgi:hypothetical protein